MAGVLVMRPTWPGGRPVLPDADWVASRQASRRANGGTDLVPGRGLGRLGLPTIPGPGRGLVGRFPGEVFIEFVRVHPFISIDVSGLESQLVLAFGLELIKGEIAILVGVMLPERHAGPGPGPGAGRQQRDPQKQGGQWCLNCANSWFHGSLLESVTDTGLQRELEAKPQRGGAFGSTWVAWLDDESIHYRRLFSPNRARVAPASAPLHMVRSSSRRSAASGRVLSTSSFSSQPRRAWPTPYLRLAKSKRLWASELMLTSTPSSFAIWQWLSSKSRRSGWALSSRKQPRCFAWRMMRSMSTS